MGKTDTPITSWIICAVTFSLPRLSYPYHIPSLLLSFQQGKANSLRVPHTSMRCTFPTAARVPEARKRAEGKKARKQLEKISLRPYARTHTLLSFSPSILSFHPSLLSTFLPGSHALILPPSPKARNSPRLFSSSRFPWSGQLSGIIDTFVAP